MAQLKSIKDTYSEPKEIIEINSVEKMNKFLTLLEDRFTYYMGCKKFPLMYLLRDDVNAPPEATDPSTNYTSVQVEMIARAPHNQILAGVVSPILSYTTDNSRLASMLKQMTKSFKTAQT